jgi:hypothetical protein
VRSIVDVGSVLERVAVLGWGCCRHCPYALGSRF